MLLSAFLQRSIELTQQILLLARKVYWRFRQHVDVKIAGGAATQITDTLAAQAEGLAALRALRLSPSSVGTVTSPPSAAVANEMGNSM